MWSQPWNLVIYFARRIPGEYQTDRAISIISYHSLCIHSLWILATLLIESPPTLIKSFLQNVATCIDFKLNIWAFQLNVVHSFFCIHLCHGKVHHQSFWSEWFVGGYFPIWQYCHWPVLSLAPSHCWRWDPHIQHVLLNISSSLKI